MQKLKVPAFKWFMFIIAVVLSSAASATDLKTQTDVDNVEIHYVLFPSTMIAPATAKALKITRDSNIQIMNVSVREKLPDSQATIIRAATISGSYFDLVHHQPLDFIQIKEQGAIYYLAPVRFPGKEAKMRFDLEIKYADDKPAAKINLNRTLYRDIEK